MTFSAIVPNYNDAASLGQALASLAGQTRPFDEILVVDDGSTDDSLDVLGRLLPGMTGARLLREGRNQGVVAALNRGLRAATGDFVILCSANDRYDPRLVERCAAMLDRHPQLCALTGNAALWDDARNRPVAPHIVPLPQVEAALGPDELVAACRRVPALLTPGFAIRRDRALQLGGLDPDLRWHSDWFLFTVLAFTGGYGFVPAEFSTVRLGGQARFSDGMFDWTQERPVIRAFVRRLSQVPDAAACFRRAALLPCYDIRELWAFRDRDLRWIITPLLVWRMAVHSAAYWMRRFLPRPLLMRMREWIRF